MKNTIITMMLLAAGATSAFACPTGQICGTVAAVQPSDNPGNPGCSAFQLQGDHTLYGINFNAPNYSKVYDTVLFAFGSGLPVQFVGYSDICGGGSVRAGSLILGTPQ